MLQQFLNHIENSRLLAAGQRVLLAVSGGIDSMVMLDLFRQSEFPFAVAHCNFQLRGMASNDDETFVQEWCREHHIHCHTKKFETEAYAAEHACSIQMAARELRYHWFDELAKQYRYDRIATAHHLNDNLETVLLNLVRGTGLDGVAGIPQQHDKIIRPLLGCSRSAIEVYAKEAVLRWREDASNQSDYYDRNFVRLKIIPLLKTLNPSLEDGFLRFNERIRGAQVLVDKQIQDFKTAMVKSEKGSIRISIQGIKDSGAPAVVLWYLIRDYGFTFDLCQDIVKPHSTGKSFYAAGYRITIDRNDYQLTQKAQDHYGSQLITEEQEQVQFGDTSLKFERSLYNLVPDKDTNVAMLDADSLTFPLTWRTWEPGDQFVPFGMEHRKKISDFLIDIKISLPEKQKVTVLESAGEICWVVGHRISELFKVHTGTREVIIIRNIR